MSCSKSKLWIRIEERLEALTFFKNEFFMVVCLKIIWWYMGSDKMAYFTVVRQSTTPQLPVH